VPVALVTGATAGIGAAFARALAQEGYDLVLVARDAQRLAGIAEELGRATVLPADLTTEEGLGRVEERLAGPVDVLVNSAGIGVNRSVLRASPDDLDRQLALNVRAVQRLTRAALPGMVERGRGDIVNVSSVAGFLVMPGSAYGAGKAFVTNFSEAVGLAVRRYGVRVMALCPGYTRTEFQQRAGIDRSRIPDWLWLSADEVARTGLRDLRRGRYVSVPDWRYKAAVLGLRYTPRWIVRAATRPT
jgi:short-subunit dehydrogenase